MQDNQGIGHDRRGFLLASAGVLAGAVAMPTAVRAEEPKPAAPAAGPSKPKVVADGEGETVWAMGVRVRVMLKSEDTGGAYSVFEDVIPPGGGPPPHTHSREDETIFVLDGELTAFLGGQKHVAKAGSWVHMPRGVEHYFKNNTDKPVRMILTYSPGGFEKWFLEVGTPFKPGDAAPPHPDPEAIKKAVAAAERFGVTFHKR